MTAPYTTEVLAWLPRHLVEAPAEAVTREVTEEWSDRPCVGTPLALWFGPSEDTPESLAARRARVEQAKALCARCPFRDECLASELARPEEAQHGIRCGLTAAERRRLVRSGVRVGGGWVA